MKRIKPLHICLFIIGCFILLAGLCLFLPDHHEVAGNDIRFPRLMRLLGLTAAKDTAVTDTLPPVDTLCWGETMTMGDTLCWDDTTAIGDTLCAKETADTIAVEVPASEKTVTKVVSKTVPFTPTPAPQTWEDSIDMRVYLHAFYQALRGADTCAVRVVHYGDSQLEGDRITMWLRRGLQEQYGGGGVGLMPLHQTVGTRTAIQTLTMNGETQSPKGGPKRYLVYGPKTNRRDNNRYGPMGQVAVMNNSIVSGSEAVTFRMRAGAKEIHTERYFNRVRVITDSGIDIQVKNSIDHVGHLYTMPDSTTSVTVSLSGQGDVYGISVESSTGVVVDNIPMRGCAGTIFRRMNAEQLSRFYNETNTQLIILQYGGNVMPYTKDPKQVSDYIAKIRDQVRFVRQCAPHASILFIGPSDMVERYQGEIRTYPMLTVMDEGLTRMAIEEQIAYYSLFRAMGGVGSMKRWKENGLAGSDYVHFTRKGADATGKMLTKWLMEYQIP